MNDAIKKVVMPKWGLSMKTGKITEWVASEGDQIADGDDLVEIDTDKIAGSLESSEEGVLRKVIADVGADVPVGATIALIAPAEVPDAEIEEAATAAAEELASGEVEEVGGPVGGKVTVGGRQIAYATVGEHDDVIVLVHGYGGDKDSWLFVQEPLSAEATVYAIDLPGHGESSKDVGDGSVATLADAVLGFLAEQSIERAHLVGHSLGGAVVTTAAARAPERVAALTLVAPAGVGASINAGYLRGFADAASRRELKPHLSALFADPKHVTRQLADDLMKYKRIDGVDAALHTLVRTLLDGDSPALDISAELAGLSVPLSIVWGNADAVLPVANAEGLDHATTVDDAGHMVHMEQPGAVVDAVRAARR